MRLATWLLSIVAPQHLVHEDTIEELAALARISVEAVILSADYARTANAIGGSLGIKAQGQLMPEKKAQRALAWQANPQNFSHA